MHRLQPFELWAAAFAGDQSFAKDAYVPCVDPAKIAADALVKALSFVLASKAEVVAKDAVQEAKIAALIAQLAALTTAVGAFHGAATGWSIHSERLIPNPSPCISLLECMCLLS